MFSRHWVSVDKKVREQRKLSLNSLIEADQDFSRLPEIKALAMVIASAVEKWQGFTYHSSVHHREVLIATQYLIEYSLPIPLEQRLALKLAAIIHDYLYEPRSFPPFEQEIRSATALVNFAKQDLIERYGAIITLAYNLILATAPCVRSAITQGNSQELPASLADLTGEEYDQSIRIISDADMFGSCGLGIKSFIEHIQWLATEIQKPITYKNAQDFLDKIALDSFLSCSGKLFNTSLFDIRNLVKSKPGYLIIASPTPESSPSKEFLLPNQTP